MNNPGDDQKKSHSRLMQFGMMACCAVMLVPVAGFFIAGGTLVGFGQSAGVFAPLLLCAGAHFVMHKMMGKSCHSKADENVMQTKTVPVRVNKQAQVVE